MTLTKAAPARSEDALRDQALLEIDELIAAVADARKELRSYESKLEKNRRHLARGGRASDMSSQFNVPGVRTALTDALNRVERARNAGRLALWRMQLSEGATIAEIARLWGISRQLVSRAFASQSPRIRGAGR